MEGDHQEENKVKKTLFARPFTTATRGKLIFKAVDNFFREKYIPCVISLRELLMGPAMVGRHRG